MKIKFLLLLLFLTSLIFAEEFPTYLESWGLENIRINNDTLFITVEDLDKNVNETDLLYKVSYLLTIAEMYEKEYDQSILDYGQRLVFWSDPIRVMIDKDWLEFYFESSSDIKRQMTDDLIKKSAYDSMPQQESKFLGLF